MTDSPPPAPLSSPWVGDRVTPWPPSIGRTKPEEAPACLGCELAEQTIEDLHRVAGLRDARIAELEHALADSRQREAILARKLGMP